MMGIFAIALSMGALGSMHCIGMCGPLAMSLPVVSNTASGKFLYTLLYNLGRITTYACMGAVLGLLGASFALAGYQQVLSIAVGIVILLFVLFSRQRWVLNSSGSMRRVFEKLRGSLGALFAQKKYQSVFFIGLLNGLLPCGLVYMAIAGAIATASLGGSVLFMMAFGLGTLSVMWGVAFFGSFISMHTRTVIKKAYPYLMILMACLLIVRGLGLGIPYLSPQMQTEALLAVDPFECH